LVPVVAAVGEDEVGLEPLQASLEVILDGGPVEGEVAVLESSDLYLHFGGAFEESGGGGAGLGLARRPAPGEDDPADDDVPPLGEEAEHRPPRPDLEVVGVGAEAEEAERLVRRAAEGVWQSEHGRGQGSGGRRQGSHSGTLFRDSGTLFRAHRPLLTVTCLLSPETPSPLWTGARSQTAQGASPRLWMSSSSRFSLNVSMHAQNPS